MVHPLIFVFFPGRICGAERVPGTQKQIRSFRPLFTYRQHIDAAHVSYAPRHGATPEAAGRRAEARATQGGTTSFRKSRAAVGGSVILKHFQRSIFSPLKPLSILLLSSRPSTQTSHKP
ncbi:hypothetical protein BC827DRAFT_225779 [Russula dissimulans]|nr:hypothetical protein BC827DRAFT_225779 [Russula dissimulans]